MQQNFHDDPDFYVKFFQTCYDKIVEHIHKLTTYSKQISISNSLFAFRDMEKFILNIAEGIDGITLEPAPVEVVTKDLVTDSSFTGFTEDQLGMMLSVRMRLTIHPTPAACIILPFHSRIK